MNRMLIFNKVLFIILLFVTLTSCTVTNNSKKEADFAVIFKSGDCLPCLRIYTDIMNIINTRKDVKFKFYVVGNRKKDIVFNVKKYNLTKFIPEENMIIGDIREYLLKEFKVEDSNGIVIHNESGKSIDILSSPDKSKEFFFKHIIKTELQKGIVIDEGKISLNKTLDMAFNKTNNTVSIVTEDGIIINDLNTGLIVDSLYLDLELYKKLHEFAKDSVNITKPEESFKLLKKYSRPIYISRSLLDYNANTLQISLFSYHNRLIEKNQIKAFALEFLLLLDLKNLKIKRIIPYPTGTNISRKNYFYDNQNNSLYYSLAHNTNKNIMKYDFKLDKHDTCSFLLPNTPEVRIAYNSISNILKLNDRIITVLFDRYELYDVNSGQRIFDNIVKTFDNKLFYNELYRLNIPYLFYKKDNKELHKKQYTKATKKYYSGAIINSGTYDTFYFINSYLNKDNIVQCDIFDFNGQNIKSKKVKRTDENDSNYMSVT